MYAELHALSNFTFLRGASHPEELVERAAGLGYAALALTDECSLAGVVRAHLAAKEQGLKLIIGSEIGLEDGPRVVLLARDRAGYGELSGLITRGRRAAPKGTYRLARRDLEGGLGACLALLVPGPGYPLVAAEREALPGQALWLAEAFPGRAWLAVELLRGADDAARLEALSALGETAGLPLVAAGDVHMHRASRRAVQDTLSAIRLGCTLSEAGAALYPNAERHLRPLERLAAIYPRALLDETRRVAEHCRFSLDELRYAYPDDVTPPGESATAYLRRLTEAGARERWPHGVPDRVRGLIAHELALIEELGYERYFLTVYDIVRFARERRILCQGRGSAANSAVCFCLGITEVDPSRMEVLFERFISRERNESPDIDVDFEHERREEVIQYVYAKYGRERAALTASVISYRPRSAIRDVGQALGLDPAQVDRMAKSLMWWDGGQVREEALRQLGLDPESPAIRRLVVLVNTLIGFPRHLSQHVGGFVIAQERLSRLVPVENAAMPERTVIQWDKDDIDALGLLKVDLLALGMLSAIRRALDLVAGYRPAPVPGMRLTLAGIPPEDPEVYAMIQRADTMGVFQIESRAQMAMLPRMRPACFYDLVIEVAIVRPGPIQGGMVHPYLRRRQGIETVSYPSLAVREVLERTLGVPIFQEQVMRLAVVAAGFTPGEADRLRRSMAAWRRKGGLEVFEARLVRGMRERGYSEAFARQIYRQIQGFAEYGFPESHSASFALLVYVSAWLKHHQPAAFTCALLNSQPMGFYAAAQLVADTRRHGVEVRPVDVRYSHWDCTLEAPEGRAGQAPEALPPGGQPVLRLGLRLIKGLSRAGAARVVEARGTQDYLDTADLARRAEVSRRDLECLAAGGALAGIAGDRHQARWAVLGTERLPPLLRDAPIREASPQLSPSGEAEDLVADYASLGLSLGRHPLALLRAHLRRRRMSSAAEVRARRHGQFTRAAGLVVNRQRPMTAGGVTFMTLEDETGHINLVVWEHVARRQRAVMLGARLLGVAGVVEREGEVVHLVAGRIEDLSHLIGELEVASRDFR